MRTRSNSIVRMDWYHTLVTRTILDFQDPVTGLLPARVLWNQQKPDPKEYLGDSWVRDNVYSILAVWGLALGYRKNADMDEDRAKAFELTQAVVKLMRGLLTCMMRQVDKVEKFKKSHAKEDALHAKYNLKTGGTCVGDNDWGHLQVDATSLYLLLLAEMTASGIQIIFTVDEVAFIQNLVFYIEKAYSIPDYGIWERGDKLNHGMPELNASSIGMAKAALEALDGLDLFGSEGGQSSVIHVLPDDIQQCKAILQSMLPRESHSKEIAASVLSVISFPAFAVQDEDIVNQARKEIISKLQGRYGLKRFLRDGYKSPMEDPYRLHYEPAELEIFENTECEWPVFFVYLMLDGLFHDDQEQVKTYQKLLEPLLVRDETGLVWMPELFYLPKEKVAMEKTFSHSVQRERGEYCPHLWSQSLYILSCLLNEKFIAVGEIDPLNRRHSIEARPDIVVQVCLLAENKEVSSRLQELDVPVAQMSCQGDPVQVLPANRLSSLYQQLGNNVKLGLTGRPYYDIGVLGTSMLYRWANTSVAFSPQFMDYQQFYLCVDNEFLADRVKSLVGFLGANWRLLGRPTLTFTITSAMLEDSLCSSIAKLIRKLKEGYLSGVRVRLGYLSDFLSTSCITTLHFVQDYDEEEVQHHSWSPFHHDEIMKPMPERETRSIPLSKKRSLTGYVKNSRRISLYNGRKESCGTLPKVSLSSGEVSVNGWSPVRTRRLSVDAETLETITQLEEATTIKEQADILHFLYNSRGPDFDVELYGRVGSTVEKLLVELYEKACQVKQWSLVRHTAGLLRKRVEDLAEAVTDIIVHEKQLTVGTPLEGQEEVVTRPLPAEELRDIIFEVFGEDRSTGIVTQELLVYLGMFVRTEPRLFSQMLRLRVGLIIKVMVAELARALDCSGDDAVDCFMNLSPFEMKSLLYHILSGEEFGMENTKSSPTSPTETASGSLVSSDVPKRLSMKKLGDTIKSLRGGSREKNSNTLQEAVSVKLDDVKGERELQDEERLGQWIRRRCLDGALNRVPEDFYPIMWKVLDRCQGITIYRHHLPHAMIREMTPGEFKFALCMETALNRIPEPEYRQLVVEMLMVLSLVVEWDPEQTLGDVIDVDQLVSDGHQMYLHDQVTIKGDSCVCCARPAHQKISCGGAAGICRYFYDTAPSGRYGTLTYFSAAVARRINALPHKNDCVLC